MSRRAFTLVELMLVTAITSVIVGALASLFVFVSSKAAQTMAKNGVLLQAQALAEELDSTLSQAQGCRVVPVKTGINGIKCVLPATGTDSDNDGVIDKYATAWVGPTGIEGNGTGRRVWFYMSNSGGLVDNAVTKGGVLWRAWRSDDGLPTATDIDPKFAFYYDRPGNKWNFIDQVEWVDNGNGTITYTIYANKLFRAERQADATDLASQQSAFKLTRTVFLKNWRR
jgi:prepilin-type N-terminal cleavage/methylation domain-containing protein